MKTPAMVALTLLIILCSVLCAWQVYAASGYPAKLNIVFTEWYPYTYQEGNRAKGFEIDIFRAVMGRMGVKAEFSQFPFKRCLKMIQDGKAHAIISVLKAPDRMSYILFPNASISISKTLFFTRAGKDISYKGSLKDLQKYTIGVISGFTYGKIFDDATYLKKEEVLDAERLINMVVNGRHDLGVENQAVIKGVARKLGVERSIRFLYPPVHTQRLYVGFSKAKGLQKFAADFSEALSQFKRTNEYREILSKYGISYDEMAQ